MGVLRWLAFTSVAGVSAVAIYAAARDFRANDLLVSINEFVQLDANDSESFTDLATPVHGEIRFESNTTSACKFLLKLNAALTNRSFFPAGSSGSNTPASPLNSKASSFNASASSSAQPSSGGSAVPLSGLEVNDIVDTWYLQKKHALVFSPACTSHQTLMRYHSVVSEEFQVPVSGRDVFVAKKGPSTLELQFELCVHRAVMDLEVLLTLPKSSKVLMVETGGVGRWQPVQGTSSDLLWVVGACGDVSSEISNGKGGRASSAGWTVKSAAGGAGRAAAATGVKKAAPGGGETPVQELEDKTIAQMQPLDGPHAPLGQFLEKVCFRMTYEVPQTEDGGESMGAASSVSLGGTGNKKRSGKRHGKSRRQQQQQQQQRNEHPDDFVLVNPQQQQQRQPNADIPAITLTYGSASAASGLLVKRLQTLSEKQLWVADDETQSAPVWRWAKKVYPAIDAPTKVSKKAQYTTRFSQSLFVLQEWD